MRVHALGLSVIGCVLMLVAACGSDDRPSPKTPIAVGPSGGDVWTPPEHDAPAATAPATTTTSSAAPATSASAKP